MIANTLHLLLMSAPPGGDGGSGGGGIGTLLPPILIMFAIFYFLMIRPQRKKEQERQQMIQELKKGDKIYLHSGIIGKIRSIDGREVVLDLEDKNKVRVLREAIAGRYTKKSDDAVVEVNAEQSDQITQAAKR
jgi:preprotein translocase subunit YajC